MPAAHTLVLVGHGSHLHPGSSEAIHRHAGALRRDPAFDRVRAGFWKEEPPLCRVLDAETADRITIVPLFMSEGYFTGTVIPREMRLAGAVTRRGRQEIRLTRPVGVHPHLADVIVERARETGRPADTGLAVLGHGTERNPESARTIRAQAARAREAGPFQRVETVFLDQAPGLDQLPVLFPTGEVIVVPLFMSEGWHVGDTIPEDLGLGERGAASRIHYTPPVGTHAVMADVIRDLVEEAGP